MDELTKNLMDNFLQFLTNELQRDKHLRHIQLDKWSIHDFKVTIKFFYEQEERELYLDWREIKENQNHFLHLLPSVLDQLKLYTKI